MPLPNELASLAGVFASIVENADAVITVTDKEGVIEYVNSSFCTARGYDSFDDVKGQSIDSIYENSDINQTLSEIKATLKKGEKWCGELPFKHQNKTQTWSHSTISAILNEGGEITYCVWVQVDITEQKILKQKQRASEQRLRGILDNVPAYVFSKNRDGKYTYANKMLTMLHALGLDEIIGKTDFDLFPDTAAKSFTKNDQTVFEKNQTIRALEYGGTDEYGIERCYLSVKCPLENEEGEVEELLGMSVDISEQYRLEQALRESEEKLNGILDNMKARVYIKGRDLKYTYANEELCRVLKTDRINLIGKDDYDLFETETAISFRTTDEEVFVKRKRVERMETTIDPLTSEKRYYWSIKMPMMDDNGNVYALLGISTDLTKQKKLEKALRKSETQLSTILDNIKAHVYIKDINFTYTYVNEDMCAYLGKMKSDVIGRSDTELFGLRASKHFHESDQQVINYAENSSSIEISKNEKTGEENYFWSVKVPLINDLGNPYAILGISTNVSEQKRLEKELREMASTDVLTGIYNRRHLLEVCDVEIQRAKRYDHELSMIMLDLDWFKVINDTYGHAIGDEAIKSMTSLCQQMLRTTDVLGRIGGEEFAILLPETNLPAALVIAERIRKNAEVFTFDTGTSDIGRFTASFGVTTLDVADENPDDLLKRCDVALYEAKESGRNKVCAG